MSAKIKAHDIRKEYEEIEKDEFLDEVVDKVLESSRNTKILTRPHQSKVLTSRRQK